MSMNTQSQQRFRSLALIFILIVLLNISSNAISMKTSDPDETLWTSFPGSFRFTPSFPDEHSRYDVFTFKQHTGDYDYLKITGQYPYARYFSFTLYDEETSTDIAALTDTSIQPDLGHDNPFFLDTSRSVEKRNYTIWLIKESIDPPKGAENILYLPQEMQTIGLFYRLYRPDQGADLKGNVPLPTIEAYKHDLSSGVLPESSLTPLSLAAKIQKLMFNPDLISTWDITKDFSKDSIRFYRINDSGLYPSSDNEYIVASLTQNYHDKIAVITLTSPRYEHSFHGEEFTGDVDVRYWSLSVGGLGMTSTPDSICDEETTVADDGKVTVLIAPNFLKNHLESQGYNVLQWGICYKPILIYRQMLANTSFSGTIKQIPSINRPPSPEDQTQQYFDTHDAAVYIDEYCPTVELYSISSFFQTQMNQ